MVRTWLLVVALTFSGCASAPPTLSPQGVAAYHGTQAIQTLDVFRDAAMVATKQNPPVISRATAQKILDYHTSAVKVILATPNGWRAAVLQGLEETVKNLPPNEAMWIAPYATLITTIANEVI